MKSKHVHQLAVALGFAFLIALPTRSEAAVTQFVFLNGMSGANEVGPNSSTGIASINTLEFDDSVGAFGRLSINLTFSGLLGTSTASHLHGFAPSTLNAGVIQGLTLIPAGATAGTILGTWSPSSADQVTWLFDGLTYVNLHSSFRSGGELRGQVVPIPEPGIVGLLGLSGLALCRRRRTSGR